MTYKADPRANGPSASITSKSSNLETYKECVVLEDKNSTCMWEGTRPSFKKTLFYAEQHDWITQEWQRNQWRNHCRLFARLPWNTWSADRADAVKTAHIASFLCHSTCRLHRGSYWHACLAVNHSCTMVFKPPGCCLWIIIADGVWLLSMAHLMAHWGSNKGPWNARAPRPKDWMHYKQHKIVCPFCRATEAVIPRAARVRGAWPLTPTIRTIIPGRGTLLYSCDTWPVRPTSE